METYMGNSIQHWYNKAKAYGDCIMDCWKIVGVCDGTKDIRDVFKELVGRVSANESTDLTPNKQNKSIIRLKELRGQAKSFKGMPIDSCYVYDIINEFLTIIGE